MLVIETHSLRKEFGDKVAVQNLTLQVPCGEVFGYLGPNGAGKTTSVKMLLGLVQPTRGEVRVLGHAPGHTATRAKMGFLPEHFRFHDWLTAAEFLRLHAELYGMAAAAYRPRITHLLEKVGLTAFRDKPLRTFSKGMTQRVGLAQALLNHPDLVILDEPTSGLDPVGRILVRDVIREARAEGAAVLLNSHLLSEVEITCDRVAFVKHGEVLQTGTLAELTRGFITVTVRATGLQATHWDELAATFGPITPVEGGLSLKLPTEDHLPALNRWLVEHGVNVYALLPHRASLEELFLQIVGTDGGL